MKTRVSLSKRVLQTAKPPPHKVQGQVWDSQVRGLFVRVGKREKTFAIEKMINGIVYRHTIGPWPTFTVDDAREQASQTIANWSKNGSVSRGRKPKTLHQALEDHITLRTSQGKMGARTASDYRKAMNRYFPDLLKMPLVRITEDHVQELWETLAHVPAGRHKAFSALRAVMNRAVKRYRLSRNLVDVVADDIGQTNETPLRAELRKEHKQFGTLLALVRDYPDQVIAMWYECVAFTGIRNEQMCKLKWEDVDLEKKLLTFREHKGSRGDGDWHIVPMSDHVADLLTRWKALSSLRDLEPRRAAHVFPARNAKSKYPYLAETKGLITHLNSKVGYRPGAHQLRKFFVSCSVVAGIRGFGSSRTPSE